MRNAFVLFAALTTACTAAKATIQIVSAEESLGRAREYEADQKALYEYTMAEQYLGKAREQVGRSEFRIADALARQSAEWADRAIIFVERRGREAISVEGLSDTQEAAAPPPPPPPPAEEVDPELEKILAPAPRPAPEPDDDDIEIPE